MGKRRQHTVQRRRIPERSKRARRKDVPGLTSDSGPRARRVVKPWNSRWASLTNLATSYGSPATPYGEDEDKILFWASYYFEMDTSNSIRINTNQKVNKKIIPKGAFTRCNKIACNLHSQPHGAVLQPRYWATFKAGAFTRCNRVAFTRARVTSKYFISHRIMNTYYIEDK